FMGFAGLHMVFVLAQAPWLLELLPPLARFGPVLASAAQVTALLALLGAGVGLYYMIRCYRIRARPFWNHKQTGFAFVACSVYLGALCLAVVGGGALAILGESALPLLTLCAITMALGLLLEGIGLALHARDMTVAESEGAVSHYVQKTTFGKTWLSRNA